MRAADAAGWLAAFGAEDVAVTVRFPQLGGWEVTSWAVAPGDAEGTGAIWSRGDTAGFIAVDDEWYDPIRELA